MEPPDIKRGSSEARSLRRREGSCHSDDQADIRGGDRDDRSRVDDLGRVALRRPKGRKGSRLAARLVRRESADAGDPDHRHDRHSGGQVSPRRKAPPAKVLPAPLTVQEPRYVARAWMPKSSATGWRMWASEATEAEALAWIEKHDPNGKFEWIILREVVTVEREIVRTIEPKR